MKINVKKIVPEKNFDIIGLSYIGSPKPNTAMFITKKVENLLGALEHVNECLIFAETGINISAELNDKHAFVFTNKPNLSYAKFAKMFEEKRFKEEVSQKVILTEGGWYKNETASIGENAYIEPGCFIGPDVQIGNNARLLAGTIIRHASIGDNFLSNECSVIGANGFTMAEDEDGNKFRIPTLGRVIIGNNVEIGAHDNISCGSGGDTIIEDNVKIDALVHIGHDVHLHQNVEITAGGIIGGFDDLGDHAYVGINAVTRNRISIGDRAVIGMGSTVTKSVDTETTVVGNPARLLKKQ